MKCKNINSRTVRKLAKGLVDIFEKRYPVRSENFDEYMEVPYSVFCKSIGISPDTDGTDILTVIKIRKELRTAIIDGKIVLLSLRVLDSNRKIDTNVVWTVRPIDSFTVAESIKGET